MERKPNFQESYGFKTVLNASANCILANTRRGRGNIALMNETVFDRFKKSFNTFEPCAETIEGRWTKRGVVNSDMVIYTSKDFRKDRAIVLYKGSQMDCPAIIGDDGNALFMIEDVKSAANFDDYFQIIEIV